MRELCKHISWYLRLPGGRGGTQDPRAGGLADLDAAGRPGPRFPTGEAAEGQRAAPDKEPHLPDGWLESPYRRRRARYRGCGGTGRLRRMR